jgi:hypothetical protein
MSNYVGRDAREIFEDISYRYFYGLRRTDKGELFISKIDQTKNNESLIINSSGPAQYDFKNFAYGEDFFEGRSVDHTIYYENLAYEQYQWDNKNISYFIDNDGNFSVRINQSYSYSDTISSEGETRYTIDKPAEEPEAFPVVVPPEEEDEDEEEEDAQAGYELTAVQNINEGQTLNIVLETENVGTQNGIEYLLSGIDTEDISEIKTEFTVSVVTNATPPGNLVFALNQSQYPSITLSRGHKYIFNQSDPSNLGTIHPLAFSTTRDGIHEGGEVFSNGVVYKLDGEEVENVEAYAQRFAVSSSRVVEITVLPETPFELYYFDYNHSNGNPDGITPVVGTDILDGVFNVFNNVGTTAITIAADEVTEGAETLTVELANGESAITTSLNDTSTAPEATYTLSTNVEEVEEGGFVTFTLDTENVPDGANINYTISGINSEDIEGQLEGVFTVNNNTGTIELAIANDSTTEGNETLTLALNNNAASASVTVLDTSLDPEPTYSLSASSMSIGEGDNLFVTLDTTNVDDNTSLSYTITGINNADLATGDISGEFVISNNTATLAFSIALDESTEGVETMVLSLDNEAASISVDIEDTSTTPEAPSGTYDLTADASSINEGESVTITLVTTNVDDATEVPYTISGVELGDIEADSLSGNFVVNNDTASVDIAITEDNATEGTETLTLSLDNGESSIDVEIADTSVTPQDSTYQLTPSSSNVNEGDSLTMTLETTNVPNGTVIGYTITGISSEDLSAGSLTGGFTVQNNSSSVELTIAEDLTTEGDETLVFSLDNGEDSVSVTVNDTSQSPSASYTLSRSTNTVNEGGSVTFTLNTENVGDGELVGYTISGIDESDLSSGSLSGNFDVSSGTSEVSFTLAEDANTEGNETMQLSLDNGEDSISVTVNDTSTQPTADYSLTVTNDGASNYVFDGTDRASTFNQSTDPTLTFNTGDIVDFDVSAPGHPFYVKTADSTGTGNQADGVTNNGASGGTVRWEIPAQYAGQTLHYNCQFHAAMHGTINVQ